MPSKTIDQLILNSRHAAEFKTTFNLPYVDGFAAALALARKASLATSDRDFSHVEKKLDLLWTL
jgi:predicted nucleic acid-binding protein